MYGSSGEIVTSLLVKDWLPIVSRPVDTLTFIDTLACPKCCLVAIELSMVPTLKGEQVFSVQSVTSSNSKTLIQNRDSTSIWGVGLASRLVLQPLRIISKSKGIRSLRVTKCEKRCLEFLQYRVQLGPEEIGKGPSLMRFAADWVVDNVNFPDNFLIYLIMKREAKK